MSTSKPRLGRGLSGLLSKPVEVAATVESTFIVETNKEAAAEPADRPGVLRSIAVDSVVPNRYQPRASMEEAGLKELSDSIRQSGVMQPIAVRRAADGSGNAEYEIVAGERRWRAARLAGLTHVPALVVALDDRGAAEWAIVENVQREDLNPIDRALAFERLIREFGATQAEVAGRVGLSRVAVSNTLRLLDLEPAIAEMVAAGELSGGHAKALLMAPPGEGRIAAARKAASAGWSVRALEQWAGDAARRVATATLKGEPAAVVGATQARAIHVAALEKQLGDHLGTRVRVKTSASGKKGRIVLDFYSLEHFEGLMARMGFHMES
ncbi:MAG: ParB/RepB/Spo0J family partition protein [Phycisphaerae bacterium]|nr:ParB/RepB/Spo0J family partition protein [Phycisphaerae bacterium]